MLAEQEQIATLVFDEVDTGVSGRAAQKVAEKLAQLACHKQVLCVTHLPQLAGHGWYAFPGGKGEQNGRTFTKVVELDPPRLRKAEIARITGGSQVTGRTAGQRGGYTGSSGGLPCTAAARCKQTGWLAGCFKLNIQKAGSVF